MCGIVAYNGEKNCKDMLLQSLKRLEYRGYDSAGLGLIYNDKLEIIKESGNIDILSKEANSSKSDGNIGIGHTRWATHGKPSKVNAHPHTNNKKDLALVHNGIIENYQDLKKELIGDGYSFYSETDTEVIVNLLDKNYKDDLTSSVKNTIAKLKGAFSLAIVSERDPDTLVLVRRESPLILGLSDHGIFASSDITAILAYTKDIVYLENEDIVTINNGKYTIENQGQVINREVKHIDISIDAASKGLYEHFMIKEINEQDRVIKDSLARKIEDDFVNISDSSFSKDELEAFDRIFITACGTAFHAGEASRKNLEKALGKPVRAEIASEFRYDMDFLTEDSLLITISQSGETADSLSVLREAKKRGAKVLAITNTLGSSLDREADKVLYCDAGPEISVASTKAYTAQVMALYILALDFAYKLGNIDRDLVEKTIKEFKSYPEKITGLLKDCQDMEELAKKIKDHKDVFYLGRGLDFLYAKEGALKLKEISYINALALPSGELKHGSIALIEDGVPVISILTQPELREKSLANVKEVKARGAYTIAIATDVDDSLRENFDYVIEIPKTNPSYQGIFAAVPQQILAYQVARSLGLNVDKPRNLAKSVTVE
ncbi:glutamine--fructose-6-phosphate transaminase (isomerizing) [Anaerococcus urinomassiliensis]|uniref:glutamine--fructose-6-phosphate transaminase (isomerizing) n=1 Tax=Anaerococcus urinomassiliensis TaxID=1745712 RepID=UPI00093BC15C|nr:glutamine--fructose-6-phosphate transaminase (isomerizing) [Anaerococcus urinomassiliensis]